MSQALQLQGIEKVTFEVEIYATEPPKNGSGFRDEAGREWRVRGEPYQPHDLRSINPPPPLPRWRIILVSTHPAYRLKSGQHLEPIT